MQKVRYVEHFWDNDKGFLWMLAIALVFIIATQFSVGHSTDMILVRISFFVLTVIAIGSSVLSMRAKYIGYGVAVALLTLGLSMVKASSPTLMWLYSIVLTSYTLFVLLLVVRQIFNGQSITFRKIGGGIAAYLLLGHLWTSLYITVYIESPEAFMAGGEVIVPDAVLRQLSYFSFVTLTTTGYGDITAIGPIARTLVIFESLTGQLFPAVFIAKLVSQQIEDSKK